MHRIDKYTFCLRKYSINAYIVRTQISLKILKAYTKSGQNKFYSHFICIWLKYLNQQLKKFGRKAW